MGFSLRINQKVIVPKTHPRRDEQFRHIAQLRADIPVISVDCQKKEYIGRFRNRGAEWKREAGKVFDHDFPSWASGKAAPYGIYDLKAHAGWVDLGLSSDTPAFAVDCIEAWWVAEGGRTRYPGATRLLVLADSGGSYGISPRAWKHASSHRKDSADSRHLPARLEARAPAHPPQPPPPDRHRRPLLVWVFKVLCARGCFSMPRAGISAAGRS